MTWIDKDMARPRNRATAIVATDGKEVFFAHCDAETGRYFDPLGRKVEVTHWFPIPTIPNK